jgi:phosphopantetheine adenylyltransferase
MIEAFDLDLDYMRRRRIENQVKGLRRITDEDLEFLTAETNAGEDFVRDILEEMKVRIGGKVS